MKDKQLENIEKRITKIEKDIKEILSMVVLIFQKQENIR